LIMLCIKGLNQMKNDTCYVYFFKKARVFCHASTVSFGA
jgi:hypothetical protein